MGLLTQPLKSTKNGEHAQKDGIAHRLGGVNRLHKGDRTKQPGKTEKGRWSDATVWTDNGPRGRGREQKVRDRGEQAQTRKSKGHVDQY